MKTIKLMTLALGLITLGANAATAGAGEYTIDYRGSLDEQANAMANNEFELINQSESPIWISVINGSKIIVDAQEIGKKSAFNEKDLFVAPIDTKEQTKIAIYKEQPKPGSIEIGFFGKVKFLGNPEKYEFPKSKTIYVTYTKDGNLVASQPELPGGRNVTRTGLDLGNNVTDQDISAQIPQASAVVAEE